MTFHALLFGLDDDFQVFTAEDQRPDAAAIDALERELGVPLEATYRAFVGEVGCAAALAAERVWPRPKLFDIRPRWQFEYGIELYGLAAGAPPALDVRARTRALREREPNMNDAVAVLGVLGVDLQLCMFKGGLFAWVDGKGEVDELGPTTFLELVRARVATLQSDKDRLVAEPATAPTARDDAAASETEASDAAHAEAIVERLVDAPYDADEILEGVDDDTRARVRDLLIAGIEEDAGADRVEALAVFDDGPANDALLELIDHDDAGVVCAAIEGLDEHDDARLVERIVDRIDHVAELRDDLTLSTAIEVIAPHVGDARILAAVARWWRWSVDLGKTLSTSNVVFETLVTRASHEPIAREIFERAAADVHPYLQVQGHGALARMGGALADHLPTLLAALASETASVQSHAERNLTALGEPVREALQAIAANDSAEVSPATRAAAERVLERLA